MRERDRGRESENERERGRGGETEESYRGIEVPSVPLRINPSLRDPRRGGLYPFLSA